MLAHSVYIGTIFNVDYIMTQHVQSLREKCKKWCTGCFKCELKCTALFFCLDDCHKLCIMLTRKFRFLNVIDLYSYLKNFFWSSGSFKCISKRMGTPNLVGNEYFSATKVKYIELVAVSDLTFDLLLPSEVKSNFTPHLPYGMH